MSFDRRIFSQVTVDSSDVVIEAVVTYESDINYTSSGRPQVQVLTSHVRMQAGKIVRGAQLWQKHIPDVTTDLPNIIGQPLATVESSFSLSSSGRNTTAI